MSDTFHLEATPQASVVAMALLLKSCERKRRREALDVTAPYGTRGHPSRADRLLRKF